MAGRIRVCYVICLSLFALVFLALHLSQRGKNMSIRNSRSRVTQHQLQEARRKVLIEECPSLRNRSNSGLARFHIDDAHRLMYCYIPKVASTTLKRFLMVLSGIVANTSDLESIPRDLAHENNPMRRAEFSSSRSISKQNLSDYTKFLFVRHPFERLVSAYQSKFVGNSSVPYQLRIGTKIIKRYRMKPSEESLQRGHDVTYPEFVSFVIEQWKLRHLEPMDVHWRPMIDLCQPCSIEYDFIGKFERLNEDINELLHKINQSQAAGLILSRRIRPVTDKKLVLDFMNQLSSQQRKILQFIYKEDFVLFEYDNYVLS